jgi:hypothetical protein
MMSVELAGVLVRRRLRRVVRVRVGVRGVDFREVPGEFVMKSWIS